MVKKQVSKVSQIQQNNQDVIKVMIGTPTLDGRVSAWYADALVKTIILASQNGIFVTPVFVAYDSMLERARNDLFYVMLTNDFDYLFFVDSDEAWMPEDFVKIIKYNKDFIGGTARRKNPMDESYVFRLEPGTQLPIEMNEEGLLETDGLGTGFLCLSRSCVQKLWDASKPYFDSRQIIEGKPVEKRMVFEVTVNDKYKEIVSEDINLCLKWKDLGGKIYFDPRITILHYGEVPFSGDFISWAVRNKIVKV